MKSIGVDIGQYSVKIAEVESSSKGVIIHRLDEIPINQDPNRDKNLEILEILRAIAPSREGTRARIVSALPLDEIAILPTSFPFPQRLKILKSAPFELEDEIPLEISETMFDVRIRKISKEQTDTLTLAAPKERIKEKLNQLKDAMLDPHILTVDAFALANLFEAWQLPPQQELPTNKVTATETLLNQIPEAPAQIILSLGHAHSLALFMQNGQLLDARSIDFGGQDVAEAIARSYSVPFVEAVRMMHSQGQILTVSAGASREQQTMSNTITGSLAILAHELRLMAIEWRTKFNVPLSEVLLTGGLSRIQNIAPFFTQNTEIPTNLYRYLDHGFQLKVEPTPASEAVMGMAIGIAIEGLRRPKNPAINFRREIFARQNLQGQKFWESWGPALRLAGIAYAILFVYGWIREDLATSQAEQAREKLQTVVKDRNFLNEGAKLPSGWYNKALQKKKDEIRKIQSLGVLQQTDAYTSALDVLKKINDVLPQGKQIEARKVAIDLSRINIINEKVEIEGRVANPVDVKEIRQALSSIALDGKINSIKTSLSAPGNGFAFEFSVSRVH